METYFRGKDEAGKGGGMIARIRVIEHDGREKIYNVLERTDGYSNHGLTAIGYQLIDPDGVKIIIHPEAVNRIEIYDGDKQLEVLKQRTHGV